MPVRLFVIVVTDQQEKRNHHSGRHVSLTSLQKRKQTENHDINLLLNHVVIVVKLCCVEGLMEDRCTSNKHTR